MPRYSEDFKAMALKDLLPPINMTVSEVSLKHGVSNQTLYNWCKTAREQGKPVPGNKKTSDQWPAEARFAVVVETASMNASELSQYCRKKGLYPEQVHAWKAACLSGFEANEAQARVTKKQARADKAEIKSLKHELRQKEKALAETAALLVLRKKLNALWEEDDKEN